ncbi:bifunctional phosphoribosylaminoimidazolecarboxamide formyltransferase/IMP cyclohydrolase [Aquibaculum arenosum]|uniref:Bifunctional purine biosynthesis protein PurH n=1 Tax=Aquibaculum arenosum TaxID=3032591 RepID=A0ABT5YHY2_9PROT|nr:bifunctional phosphoribosylaminoimidazolecarboxamide formyltransferase/IMP cyclohydrolase [Fodinicurvata sp. CAU 1616]MDF2094522.1 bifunctional phosphoribosylaminoimidazolecarboxamide formyltransferase/IMP cyclohydrolase [Fodinicurvata sp. CAU 1616]
MTSEAPVKIERALLSVSDKSGLANLGRGLAARGIEVMSTGGSAKALRDVGIPVTEVADYTGFPEIMDGRVKTLHPKIHGGLLGRRDLEGHRQAMTEHGIGRIDLLAVNLYPFRETLASGADRATCIENIDIGGPAMIRAAAKNHGGVVVLTDPADYEPVMEEIRANDGSVSAATCRRLAAKAYACTAAYDAAIAAWMSEQEEAALPTNLTLAAERVQTLRYGENPHQQAAFYRYGTARPGVATAEQLQGKELSYNNLNDTDAAFEAVSEFEKPAVVIVKHANPCGVAEGTTSAEVYRRALACDPISAYGGIVALNRPLDAETASLIVQVFAEVVIAPEIEPAAQEVLAGKKNLRLLRTGSLPDPAARGLALKSLAGGLLLQDRDHGRIAPADLKVVTKRTPSDTELADLLFAFRVAKHVKSNAIVYAKGGRTIGIGAGQMSRVDSSRIAALKAREAGGEEATKGSVVASDAFFPFADGLQAAIDAGATAVIQPGGSMRDEEVIAAADAAGLAMVFTGMRHFRH